METTKLTLRPTKQIAKLAHKIAKEDNTSITQMFSNFILALQARKEKIDKVPMGPLTREATGMLKLPQDWDYKKEMEDVLEVKYGVK